MPRARNNSRSLKTAQIRLIGLNEIETPIDFGSGFDTDNYESLIQETTEVFEKYNALLLAANDQRDTLDMLERKLNDANERILYLIGGFFGKDSPEYQWVGGTRKSKFNNNRPVTYDPNGSEDTSGDDSGDGTETP